MGTNRLTDKRIRLVLWKCPQWLAEDRPDEFAMEDGIFDTHAVIEYLTSTNGLHSLLPFVNAQDVFDYLDDLPADEKWAKIEDAFMAP